MLHRRTSAEKQIISVILCSIQNQSSSPFLSLVFLNHVLKVWVFSASRSYKKKILIKKCTAILWGVYFYSVVFWVCKIDLRKGFLPLGDRPLALLDDVFLLRDVQATSSELRYMNLLYDWYTKACNNPNRRVQISCVIAPFETRLNQFLK